MVRAKVKEKKNGESKIKREKKNSESKGRRERKNGESEGNMRKLPHNKQ